MLQDADVHQKQTLLSNIFCTIQNETFARQRAEMYATGFSDLNLGRFLLLYPRAGRASHERAEPGLSESSHRLGSLMARSPEIFDDEPSQV